MKRWPKIAWILFRMALLCLAWPLAWFSEEIAEHWQGFCLGILLALCYVASFLGAILMSFFAIKWALA